MSKTMQKVQPARKPVEKINVYATYLRMDLSKSIGALRIEDRETFRTCLHQMSKNLRILNSLGNRYLEEATNAKR